MERNKLAKASTSSSTDVSHSWFRVLRAAPGMQAHPPRVPGAAGKAGAPARDLGGTDKQYLTIVLVLQLLHVSPPNS